MVEALLFKGGRVVDPVNGVDAFRDLAVQDGIIVSPSELGADYRVIELAGAAVTPGLIDMHVHLRDPGQTDKEDIATGTQAAARGGFTAILAMPNTTPPIDNRTQLENVIRRIDSYALVRVLQCAALSKNLAGRELTDACELRDAGAAALTDDGHCIPGNLLMYNAMRNALACGIPVIDHAEDSEMAGSGSLHDGEVARKLGVQGKNRCSEELAVARDIVLARQTGCPVHIQHVSSAGTVAMIRMARQWGVPVTGEVTPHHITLNEEACLQYGTNAKMNPPLRAEADRQAIIEGLADGTLTVIATDHAPHTQKEKEVEFAAAPCGIIGLETAFGICLTELYHKHGMALLDVIAKFTQGPRQVLDLPYGTLSEGVPADLTIIDLDIEKTIEISRFASKSRNCPYDGWHCKGQVLGTMIGGRWVYKSAEKRQDGKLLDYIKFCSRRLT